MNSRISKNELICLKNKCIIITGGQGMLGVAFSEVLTLNGINENVYVFSKSELDVTIREDVLDLQILNPDYIIHCAALVNADYCENNEEEAKNIIVNGTKNIIELSRLSNAKLFYPQSFLIYDGHVNPINEETLPNPLSVYGKLKLESEKLIIEAQIDSLVVRMAGFFGGREKDKNFVGKFISHIIKLIRNGKNYMEIGDRIWQPTFTNDLANNVLVLLANNKKGIYCMSSHGKASFYELSLNIIDELGLNNKFKVLKVKASQVTSNASAMRPKEAIIENSKLINEGFDFQRTWEDSLKEYLKHAYFKNLTNEL